MSKIKSVPAYLTLVVDIMTRATALGLKVERDMGTPSTLPENKGYVFVRVNGGSAALIVPKHADEVKWCDSHIDWEGEDGHIPLEKENGAVICRIDPSETDLDSFLKCLSGASRRSKKVASKAASPEMAELLAVLQALGFPAASPAPAAQTPAPSPEPEVDGQFEDELTA